MTTYVLDSSVAFKWVVPEIHTDKALLLRDDFRNGAIQLIAPDIFPLEVLHALTKAERQKRINPTEAITFWLDIMTTCPILSAYLPLAPRACAIATKAKIGIYDCLYVALAEQEKCELVTADDKLVKNLQGQFAFIRALASFPKTRTRLGGRMRKGECVRSIRAEGAFPLLMWLADRP